MSYVIYRTEEWIATVQNTITLAIKIGIGLIT